MATELGAEVIRVKNKSIAKGILEAAEQKQVTTICIGKPHLNLINVILGSAVFNKVLKALSASEIDIIILS